MHLRMIGGMSLCAEYSLPRECESCIDGRVNPHENVSETWYAVMMSRYARFPCRFPAVVQEFAHKALIFRGLLPNFRKISLLFPCRQGIRRRALL
jgi:hypothetical protein